MYGWVRVTHDVILKNITPPNNLLSNSHFANPTVDYKLYMFLACMPIFMPIGYNLPFDL